MVSKVVIDKIEKDATNQVKCDTYKAVAGGVVAEGALYGGAIAGDAIANHTSGFGEAAALTGDAAVAIPVALLGVTKLVKHASAARVHASTAGGKVAAAAIEGSAGFAAREDARAAQAATAVQKV